MTHGGRLLLVEDEPSLARLLASYLGRAGFIVDCCGSAAEAARLYQSEGAMWECGVFDLSLPDAPGETVAAEFRRRFPEARIVLTSGLLPARKDGVPETRFLQKPFAPRALVDLLLG